MRSPVTATASATGWPAPVKTGPLTTMRSARGACATRRAGPRPRRSRRRAPSVIGGQDDPRPLSTIDVTRASRIGQSRCRFRVGPHPTRAPDVIFLRGMCRIRPDRSHDTITRCLRDRPGYISLLADRGRWLQQRAAEPPADLLVTNAPDLRRRRLGDAARGVGRARRSHRRVGRAADLERLRGAGYRAVDAAGPQRRARLQRHPPAPVRRRLRRRARRRRRRRHGGGGAGAAARVRRGPAAAVRGCWARAGATTPSPAGCRRGRSSMPWSPIGRPSSAASTTTRPGSTRRRWRWPGSPATRPIR